VAGASDRGGDEGGEQVLDLVAGDRDQPQRWWVAVAAQLPTQLSSAVLQAARGAFVAGMQRSSVIAAVVAVGVAIMALVTLRDRPAASTRETADKELAGVSASGHGQPNALDG
jgi:hypothetical protein